MSSSNLPLPPDDTRRCARCSETYSPAELENHCAHYFEHPYRYIDGVDDYCLACWLGVGPLDRDDELLSATSSWQ